MICQLNIEIQVSNLFPAKRGGKKNAAYPKIPCRAFVLRLLKLDFILGLSLL
jgi:hypothetical protein